jgi:solute carrier family 25 iron transporter 28/37
MDASQAVEIEWDEVLDWEDRSSSTPFWKHAVAGSVAGITEHTCTYPLDTIKTHMQAYRGASPALSVRAVVEGVRSEFGAFGLLRGLPVVVTGVVPAHAAMFSTYEYVKLRLDTHQHHTVSGGSSNFDSVLLACKGGIAGASSTLAHDAIMTPCDVIKQRMQLGCYENISDCVRHIVRTEGGAAFIRSVPTTLAMNVPFGAAFVACNEVIKKSLRLPESGQPSERRKVLPWYFVSAAMSGAVAALATQPLDVVKTRLQTQDCVERLLKNQGSRVGSRAFASSSRVPDVELVAPRYAGFFATVRVIFTDERLVGFVRGAHMRMAVQIPAGALAWGTYEVMKNLLSG